MAGAQQGGGMRVVMILIHGGAVEDSRERPAQRVGERR
jgi:hypothetical protein